jgi:hypothetical protein
MSETEPPQLNLDDFRIPERPAAEPCAACGRRMMPRAIGEGPPFCLACRRKYPDSLLKATCDPFEYALKLRTGEVWYFTEARIDGDYVHLDFTNHPLYNVPYGEKPNPLPHCFERGVEVRASDIVWCADAPDGS